MNYIAEVWRGPSRFTGREVVALITTRSNVKVGGAPGLIVRAGELKPEEFDARFPGGTWFHEHKKPMIIESACGKCPMIAGRKCYVQHNVQNASQPAAASRDDEFAPPVRRAIWKSGKFRSAIAGDAAALPEEGFNELLHFVKSSVGSGKVHWLGYTHDHTAKWLQGTHVASCESMEQAAKAREDGWRTFTAVAPHDVPGGVLRLPRGSFYCPAAKEAANVRGRAISCGECGACTGTDALSVDKPNGVILRHSSTDHKAKRYMIVLDWRGRVVAKGDLA
jgi:hypothetical protein